MFRAGLTLAVAARRIREWPSRAGSTVVVVLPDASFLDVPVSWSISERSTGIRYYRAASSACGIARLR